MTAEIWIENEIPGLDSWLEWPSLCRSCSDRSMVSANGFSGSQKSILAGSLRIWPHNSVQVFHSVTDWNIISCFLQYPEKFRKLKKGNCSYCRKCTFFLLFIHTSSSQKKKLLGVRPCSNVEVQVQWKHGLYLKSCCCQLITLLPPHATLARSPCLWESSQLASLLRKLLHVEQ